MYRFIALMYVVACITLAPTATAQLDVDKIEIESIALADNVFMLTGSGGNIGVLVGEEGIVMIDDQYAPLSTKIMQALGKLSAAPVRFLINTHWHFDHTGGNENFGKAGAIIVAHDNVRRRMSRDEFMETIKRDVPASPPIALPAVTFAHRATFHFGGETLTAHHTPFAHTDGDLFVHFANANVIHAGDVFWNRFYPLIDTGSDGGIDGMIAGAKKILALANEQTKIIPGHGKLASRADLEAYIEMLETTRSRINDLIGQYKRKSEVLAARPLADFDDTWGNGFMDPERFLSIVYDDLATK